MTSTKKPEPARELTAAVLDVLADGMRPDAPAPVQEEMFARPAVPAAGSEQLSIAAAASDAETRRKAGRPPGSPNRSNVQMRQYLLNNGVNPHKWMMDWLILAPEELAQRLGCKVVEAFDRQALLADRLKKAFMPDLAPTDEAGKAAPVLNFTIGGVAATANKPPWEIDMEARAAAGLIDAEAQEVDDADA